MDGLLQTEAPVFSVITEIELLSWSTTSQADLTMLHEFIRDAVVIELDSRIKYKTAGLRKMYRIKLPDAIIAATAIVFDATLRSRNVSDFKKINGLKPVNPWDN